MPDDISHVVRRGKVSPGGIEIDHFDYDYEQENGFVPQEEVFPSVPIGVHP
jgi:hypothetical protein